MSGTVDGLRLQILGPLRVWRGDVELDAGPRQQACLLAVLLARAGHPVSTTELLELLWGEQAPDSALNVIHKYIGALRRVFEPSVPVRGTGSHLFRHGNGYLFTSGAASLDWDEFRDLVAAARRDVGHDPAAALERYVRALELWKGPAGDGLDYAWSAASMLTELNTQFFDACVAAAELAVSQAVPQRLAGPLRLAAAMAPLNEPVHAALITVLAAAGQQAEALDVFRALRDRLAEQLGIDPGQTLQRAYHRVLSQADEQHAAGVVPGPSRCDTFVGRVTELAAVRESVDDAVVGGTGLVLLEGEPGIGKTRLLEESAAAARARGAVVAWGNCPPESGTPTMWPWVQTIRTVLLTLTEQAQLRWRATEIGFLLESDRRPPTPPDSGARFRLSESVTTLIGEVAAVRPVLLVMDDLQWADLSSLELFAHLASRLPRGVALIGGLRDRAPAPRTELTRMLAATSRVPGVRRIRLEAMNADCVAEIIRIEAGSAPGDDVVAAIQERTSGNPFFVRELSRMLSQRKEFTDCGLTGGAVPATVRDVVLDRVADLDEGNAHLLFTAAIIGRDVDLRVLARALDLGVQDCLDRLGPLADLGILVSTTDPFGLRFVHDLVRDAVVELVPPHRAARLHAHIAGALEMPDAADESVDERLAHHLWAAGPCVDLGRTAQALMRAARQMTNKCAFEAAEEKLRAAEQVARRAALPEVELAAVAQLTALVGMRSMYGGDSGLTELLERAEQLALALGRDRDAAGFLYSRWAAHAQAIELEASYPLARRLLDRGRGAADPIVRSYGFQAWGIQQWDAGNINEAFRYLDRSKQTLLEDLSISSDGDPVRRDLQWLMTGMLAETTALHGDVGSARELIDTLEAAAGEVPYMITVWATMACRIAAIVGDPQWALRAAARGIGVDPEFNFVFLGTYQRLARYWALAMTHAEPAAAAAAAEKMIAANLLDPPRSCVATWYALLAEMWISAGDLDRAARSLDRADWCLHTYGQRYPEGLLLLVRARLLHGLGAPLAQVHAAAQRACAVSAERGAHLFVQRADALLGEMGLTTGELAG